MNSEEKKAYLEKYQQQKEKGVPFFPDILFKDAVIALVVFLALIALAALVGAPLEERADPADTSYTPRPEWYFLFLFQFLKYFPGKLEVIGAFIVPTLLILALFALPFLDRSSRRHFAGRPLVLAALRRNADHRPCGRARSGCCHPAGQQHDARLMFSALLPSRTIPNRTVFAVLVIVRFHPVRDQFAAPAFPAAVRPGLQMSIANGTAKHGLSSLRNATPLCGALDMM